MSHPVFNPEECSACGLCVDVCPQGVIEIVEDHAEATNEEACIGCEMCVEECPMGALLGVEED
jgi:NAD-dependent dihydropyrimidine dehydrogenase PreA subunit